ncbi:MAG: hypothetical protein ACRDPA_24095 [Solirubrobacteraceae bacterium]
MNNATTGGERPTPKQLAYLRSLAERTGQTFAYPHSRRQASHEIGRLEQAEPSTRGERALERKDIADAIARGPEDAARVRLGELAAFGSTATWKNRS